MNDIDTTLADQRPYHQPYSDNFIHLIIFFGIATACIIPIVDPIVRPSVVFLTNHRWSNYIVKPSLVWFSMGMVLLLIRTLLWIRYRPFASASMYDAPYLTVVIPAYNEGELVKRSILSAAAANYPHDRLEILVIDDGSRDDTWQHIESAAREYPNRVRTIRFAENRLFASFVHFVKKSVLKC